MKKLLVLFLSGILVLSLAAVALAEVTVKGDFRYNMYEDESATRDQSYAETDCRIRVTGDLSDTAQASANFKWKRSMDQNTREWDLSTDLDEFYATWKPEWGTMKMGFYEYKFTPSRCELKSSDYHVWKKADALFEVNIPVAEGITVDALCQLYENDKANDGAYGVALNYQTENWGAKFSYADFQGDEYGDLTAIDVYYLLNEDIKFFVDAVDYSENDGSGKYDDGFDPVIGVNWSNIAETNLNASFEYAINPRNDGAADEYSEYILTAKYKLDNNIGLEFYHYIVGDDLTKDQFRIRYQF
jgi:hypothetical protein